MTFMSLRRWLLAAAALTFGTIASAQVRVSEFHYDNVGADVGEQIEVSAPAGTDLTGWSVVLYNGNGGVTYDTRPLSGVVPATCSARGVVVVSATGMQNGSPDGLALVNNGVLVEFLSYEGPFAATNGAAAGTTATDIGVFQNGSGPVGESLARNAAGIWSLGLNSFGACNDDGTTPPAPEVASVSVAPASATLNVGASLALGGTAFDAASAPIANAPLTWSSNNPAVATVNATGVVSALAMGDASVVATAANGVAGSSAIHVNSAPPPPTGDFHINEIHYDNAGPDTNEAIEIEGPAGADVSGFTLVLYNGNGGVPYGTQVLSGTIPATCGARGVVVVNYPADGIQNGPDGVALVSSANSVLDFISYEGSFAASTGPAAGLSAVDIQASQSSAVAGNSLQRGLSLWFAAASSFGACNADGPTPGSGNYITVTGRTAADPALPVGYEDQLFPTLRDLNNQSIATTFVWSSDTPAIASIAQNGVMRALGAGTAILRATAADGTSDTISLPTINAVASGVSYAGNTEFGEPQDADPSDDFIIRRDQYTTSYNRNRGSPNWVSYDLDGEHFGAEDRCDCFTHDAALPPDYPVLSTDDYTGAGTFHGYGIDRGHMVRSFDRTTASLDNAVTYLLSNVVPQAADMNQGPWASFESYLGDRARVDNREVYIITGPAGNKGTLKDLGRIVIPTSTWKVAVLMNHNEGLANVTDYRDLEVLAVNMPNEAGVRNIPWQTYLVTVDSIEALTGYNLLALLPDDVESAVESNTQPPIARIAGPAGAIAEGDSVSLSAAASLDPNGSVVSYTWDFGDGAAGEGVSVTHAYAQDGAFTVNLMITDNDGLIDFATFVVNVVNVAPVVAPVADSSVQAGTALTISGSFTDPGAEAWTATVDWGDGTPGTATNLSGRSFSLTHTYATAGSFTASIQVADDDATGSDALVITVTAPPAAGLGAALPLIDQLIATGKIKRAAALVLKAEIVAAQRLIDRGNRQAAITLLRSTAASIDLLVLLRQVTAADIAPVRSIIVRTINSL